MGVVVVGVVGIPSSRARFSQRCPLHSHTIILYISRSLVDPWNENMDEMLSNPSSVSGPGIVSRRAGHQT